MKLAAEQTRAPGKLEESYRDCARGRTGTERHSGKATSTSARKVSAYRS